MVWPDGLVSGSGELFLALLIQTGGYGGIGGGGEGLEEKEGRAYNSQKKKCYGGFFHPDEEFLKNHLYFVNNFRKFYLFILRAVYIHTMISF